MERDKTMGTFPAYFNEKICNQARSWFEQGQPALTPIFVRNVVEVRLSEAPGFGSGQPIFTPMHEEFILVDGQESILPKERNKAWVNETYAVNPAQWPSDPMSQDGLCLLVAVDPTLPERTSQLLVSKADSARKSRVEKAMRQAFENWHKDNLPPVGGKDIGYNLELADGTLVYRKGGFWGSSRVYARVDKKGGLRHPAIGHMGGETEDHIIEVSGDSFYGSLEGLPSDELYQHRLAELTPAVEQAKSVAEAASIEFAFPTGITVLEKGYPKLELPVELKLGHDAGTVASIGRVLDWYAAACKMAKALGYVCVSEYRSGTGRTEESRWILPGKADPKAICAAISRVDYQRGVLYSPKDKVGRVIGRGGETIKKIEQLTGRRWRVQAE